MAQSRWLPLTSTSNTTGSSFISSGDITDSLALDFINTNDSRVVTWLESVDGEILSIAQEREVTLTAISTPIHYKIFEYACSYFCFLVFQDSYGRNDPGQGVNINNEGIKLKLEYYHARCQALRPQLTREMFMYTNLALIASQRAGGTISILRT